MVETHRTGKLAVILHADIADSTTMVQQDEHLSHDRIQDAFRRFGDTIGRYRGRVHELRGDALLAEFERASDAVAAVLAFQVDQTDRNALLNDKVRPSVRVGIAMGEVVIADSTVTGAGVVLAQRVEQLSEPGSLCITGAIQEALPQRLPFNLESLGEKTLKGFDEPTRVYRVALNPGESIPPPPQSEQVDSVSKSRWLTFAIAAIALLAAVGTAYFLKPQVLPVDQSSVEHSETSDPGKSSIAVLPFKNMSDDPSQEYFVDGMTEDLITDLAKIGSMFVIARNTMFTYKNKNVVVPEVARALGVKYVLEGSARRVGNQVRINIQLIDGTSGTHLWAERYDGSLTDIFKLQDKVLGEIVAELKVVLTPEERERQQQKDTDNVDAHDAYLKGWQLYRRATPEDFVKAIPYFKRAVELDPDYGQAWAALASIYLISYQKSYAWSLIVNPNRSNLVSRWGARRKAQLYLEQAMKHPTPLAYRIKSQISFDYRQFDDALSEAAQAIKLNQNDPEGHKAMAWALIFAGRAEEAIASAEKGLRLDPYYPASHLYALGTAHLILQQFNKAEAVLHRAIELNPESKDILAPLTVAYANLDRLEEARTTVKQYTDFMILHAPKIETYMDWWPFKREVDMRLFGLGLVKAGICCEDQLEAFIDRARKGGTLE